MPGKQFTKENAAEMGRRGQAKQAENRRKRKTLRKVFKDILGMPAKKGDIVSAEDVQAYAELKGQNITMETALALAMMKNALKGDVRAAEFVRDTIGEKPVNDVKLDGGPIVIVDDIKDVKDNDDNNK